VRNAEQVHALYTRGMFMYRFRVLLKKTVSMKLLFYFLLLCYKYDFMIVNYCIILYYCHVVALNNL